MADDTREKPSETRSAQPQKIPPPDSKPQISTYIHAPQNANLLPGGTENTAGGKAPAVPGLVDVAKSIKYEEFKDIHKKPCVRDSLLTGIASGFGIGGVRAIVGGGPTKAANWAVSGFCILSIGTYQFCQYRRYLEKQGMRRAVEIVETKQKEEKAKMDQQRQAREEQKRKQAEQTSKSWYKFW